MPSTKFERYTLAPIILCLLLWGGNAHAAPPEVKCVARVLGSRTIAGAQILHFFDPTLIRLIRLGLEGRIDVNIDLMQRRRFFFDRLLASASISWAIVYEPTAGVFLVNGKQLSEDRLDRLELPGISLGRDLIAPRNSYYVTVSARLQVATTASLGRMARWIIEDSEDESTLLPSGIISFLADDMARRANNDCELARG
ncbi:MAG: hypothetical protein V2A73_00060 [Pseudomonadota bacterium]